MRNQRTEVLAWIDERPYIEDCTEVICDECGYEGDIYIYHGDELCADCLIDRLIDDEMITPGEQVLCDDCDRDVNTYIYGGQSWCAECLVLELQHDGIIKEV